MRIVMVAAYARNRAIGHAGGIPWQIPEDFAHFKRVTLGHTLVMGRATWDSIGRPLPGRDTIVITRDRGWDSGFEGVRIVHSLADALALAQTLPGDIVIAGGAQIYAQALSLATDQILSEIDRDVDGDAFYPDFDAEQWREVRREHRPDLGLDWVWWQRC